MSNLELRIDESSDLSFDAVDFVGVPFAPTVEVEEIEGGHRVSITSMGAEGKKTDEFDVMDGADGATWLSGNVLIGELAEGTVLTADDAYAAPPKGVEVFGVSTQVGTPTPDAPVPILSVDALTLHASADGTTDYTNWPVQIPLSNHIARSLPDGTEDSLTLSYIGPSETEGWGVFSKVLTQRVGELDPSTLSWTYIDSSTVARFTVRYSLVKPNSRVLCTKLASAASYQDVFSHRVDNSIIVHPNAIQFEAYASAYTDATAFKAALAGSTLLYALATPITHDLGMVELPVNPAPDLTAWADGGSAQPTLAMEYERALSIVIPRIEAAISDLATS